MATSLPTVESEQAVGASLERLPPEILLLIIFRLPNLDALHNLLQASPRARRRFNRDAPAIVEAVMSGPDSDSLLPKQIQDLIRAVILVRASRFAASAFPFGSPEALHARFLRPRMTSFGAGRSVSSLVLDPRAAATNSELWRWTQHHHNHHPEENQVAEVAAVFRTAVATARHIAFLARTCLAFYLARIRDPRVFQPLHCHDPDFGYRLSYDWISAWDQDFVGEPAEVRDAGPPSWVEQMRIERALWLVQLIGELRRLARDHCEALGRGWTAEDVERLGRSGLDDFGWAEGGVTTTHATDLQEVRTVLDYLREIGGDESGGVSHHGGGEGEEGGSPYFMLPCPPLREYTPAELAWEIGVPDPCESVWAGVGFLYNHGNRTERMSVPPPEVRAVPGNKLPQPSEASRWGRTRDALGRESPGVAFFRLLTSDDQTPVPGVRFDSFRRLGLAVWDQTRLHLLGLTDGADGFSRRQFYFFAWESVLPGEEVASLKGPLRASSKENRDRWFNSLSEADQATVLRLNWHV
ncbi:hypothetical protein BX600DRAFT_514823 [Xylariales sp. PMI_506]|nr:hypothetical protein BX600DRAFT_514823 [Xylariales sp. PMI_506]